jgi:hypothetical protein
MSASIDHGQPVDLSKRDVATVRTGHNGQGGHGWMMIACCIPMLVIAVALVASGLASPGLLFAALMCTTMMALMMRGVHKT